MKTLTAGWQKEAPEKADMLRALPALYVIPRAQLPAGQGSHSAFKGDRGSLCQHCYCQPSVLLAIVTEQGQDFQKNPRVPSKVPVQTALLLDVSGLKLH